MSDLPKGFNHPPPPAEPLRILLVQSDSCQFLQVASKYTGLPVSWVTAISDAEAISYLKTWLRPSGEGRKVRLPDLIILDTGKSGQNRLGVLEFIRKTLQTQNCAVLVLTDHDPTRRLAVDAGADFVFQRPNTPGEALDLIHRILMIYGLRR
jgi:CheY-like chemotaxis protein